MKNGVQMNSTAEQPDSGESRRAPRAPASASVALRRGMSRSSADVLDLSASGARIRTIDPLVAGTRIWLKLPMVEPLESTVVWVDRFEAGCAFTSPLHPAVFQVVLRSAQ